MTVDFGADEEAMARYKEEGTARALAMDNRGPIRFTADGALDPAILEAYSRHGFYIFEGLVGREELDDIERDVAHILDRAPATKDAPLDKHGRPALGADLEGRSFRMVKPLSDPFGGTDANYGRHPVKMIEPQAAADTPDEVVYLILGSLQFSDACLRTYGHPDLLAVAAAVNGDDFVPFTDALFIKEPGLGASVAWHQDGTTHWDSETWDQGSHGFNFMGQLYGCTPANGVWVVPGSHKLGKIDIAAVVAEAGTERLPDAVPIICKPGDVAITNRQTLHGSFANTSPDWRVTVNMGCHRRASILDVEAGGLHNRRAVYDADRIRERSRIIGYAIDARHQRFPDETPFTYQPHAEAGEVWRWTPEAKAAIKDYNLFDLSI